MSTIEFNCTCRSGATKWLERAPNDMHRYRVNCGTCGKFIKWGTDRDLVERKKVSEEVTIHPYTPPASLDAFMDDD